MNNTAHFWIEPELGFIPEPQLSFGFNQKTADPRDGLMLYGPFDREKIKGQINIGIIGCEAQRGYLKDYLKKLHSPILSREDDVARPFFPGLQSVVSNYLSTVNADYYKPKKTDFLRYTYNYQQLPPYRVLDSLQANHLVSRISSYSYSEVSYNQPFNPNVVTNLYISDSTMRNRYFDTLVKILNWVQDTNTVNPGHLFFDTNKVVVRSIVDSPLIAYRCADGTYWYRYFGYRDTMFNVFVAMPPWIPDHEHPLYELVSVGPPPGIMLGLGDSTTRYFTLNLHKTGDPTVIQARGMTTFVIGKNIELDDVLLGNPITTYAGRTAHDTFHNCERDLLSSCIREGTLMYENYMDSIVASIRTRYIPHLLTAAQEKLNIGYWNQEFNYTLYYYDRAGNLTKTVPPAGVNFVPSAYWDPIDTARMLCTTDPLHVPAHTKTSTYNYNSINQVVKQNTPDAGETRFFYDPAGRLIFSQNEKQKTTGYFTYNLYDKQNRIIETGEAKLACPYFADYSITGPWYVGGPPLIFPACYFSYPFIASGPFSLSGVTISASPPFVRRMLTTTYIETPYDSIYAMIRGMDRRDVVMTIYDTVAKDLYSVAGYGLDAQLNLRKRVAAVKYFKSLSVLDTFFRSYHYANHYSYDIAGNVKSLVQEYPALEVHRQRYKRVDYDYDLISGKVNLLSYNRSFADQFYQRYAYDDDNRISKVETSNDGIIWKRDAEYTYYQHGPLARIDVGDHRVQGIDFAYTIQGWLKAMNGDTMNVAMDMGEDGSVRINARDAAFYSIDYFKDDYKPITSWQMKHVEDESRSLYNGNISRQTMAMHNFQRLNKQYIYDQLNRISTADYSRVNATDSSLIPVTDYHSNYAYDMDGNIQSMLRYGNDLGSGATVMDSLTYYYGTGIGGYTPNELKTVSEKAADVYDLDIRHNFAGDVLPVHYKYDPIGNTTKDLISGQDTIKWNLYNKVTETQNHTADNTMSFDYDGAGNRVGKYFEQVDGDTITERNDYWVHDAQGNILARYRETTDFKINAYTWIPVIHVGFIAEGGTTRRYLDDFVTPVYGHDSRFQDRAVAYAMVNPTFKSYMLSKPVSWFMEHSNNLYNNMVHGDVTYVMPLVEYEQAGTDTLLGPAVAEMGASHANVFNSMMLTLLDNASVDAHALGLVCRTGDPGDTLMAHLALAVGIDDTLLGCDSMAAYLTDNVAPPVISGAFTELIRQPGAPLAGYSQWLVSDTNIYNYNMYSDPGSDYQAILQASGAYYADRAKMRAFFDAYSGAANLLATVSTEEDLLRICYNADLPAFLTAFDSIVGSAALDSAIAEAGVHRTPMAFASSLFGSTGMPSVPAFWTTYDTILNGYSFGLAEHDFYGSSRLGIKTYWPGQVGAIWDMVHHTADTIRLWERKPWYSAEYQDVIKDTSRDLHDNTHTTAFQFKHINGQRQYEVTDHLGDVLATLSDARNAADTTTPDSIDVYTPVVHSAYDYYPFGMYMPGRHTEDSATHCNWFTQAQTIRVYDSTWVGWTHTAGGLGTVGGGVISPYPGGGVTLSTTTTGDGLAYAMSISPGDHEFDFDIAGSSADYLLTITEGNNLLASTTIPTSTTGIISVPFTVPGGVTSISVGIEGTTSGAGTLSLLGHWHVTPRIDTVNVLTSVCSGEKYPYGHNGQMKVNEWAGIGNHMTAKFWEQDTRTGRRYNLDPKPIASISDYVVWRNNSIWYKDPNGDIAFVDDAILGFAKGLFAKKEELDGSRIQNAFKRAGSQVANTAKIYGGLLTTDKDKSVLGQVGQIVSRFSYELPQTLLGLGIAQTTNTLFNVKSVDYKKGATQLKLRQDKKNGDYWAFTVGSFITGSKSSDVLFKHEYGHYLQSQTLGPLYLPLIAIPSVVSGAIDTYDEHDNRWFERDATRRGNKYLNRGTISVGQLSVEKIE